MPLMIQPKKAIKKLTPYVDGNHSEYLINNHNKILKLDSNEPTAKPSPKVTTAIINYLSEGPMNWYPDVKSEELCRHISKYTQLPIDHILTFNGSDHALECIARTFLDKGDETIIFQPTYDHFRVYAQSCDATIITSNEDQPGSLTDKITSVKSSNLRMVYMVNPNNPTGFTIPLDQIKTALETFSNVLFIIDEAYFEFCGITAASLVTEFNNIIITRSFSKAFGLASLRCGYILAHPTICEWINKIRVGKNVNAIAQTAATAALKDIEYMKAYVEEVNLTKEWILGKFKEMGISTIKTPVNFILLKVECPELVTEYFEKQNIYLRNRSMVPNLKGFIRLTIGSRLIMNRFWKIFESAPKELLFETNKTNLAI